MPPDLVANALRVQPHCNLIHADPAHIPIEYLFYDFGFLWIDSQLAVDIIITERGRGIFIGAVRHTLFYSQSAVARDRHGFLLGELAVYRQHHFRTDFARIDIFFFEVYRHAKRFQLAYRLEAVFGISREPRYRFCQYPIDLSLEERNYQSIVFTKSTQFSYQKEFRIFLCNATEQIKAHIIVDGGEIYRSVLGSFCYEDIIKANK